MLERPIHDSQPLEVLTSMNVDQATQTEGERLKSMELNQNFMNSIQELQLFFEQYQGTHSER